MTTEAVLDSPAYEVEPYVGNGYFAWAQASEAHSARFNVYARPDAGSRFKVNPKGTVGFATTSTRRRSSSLSARGRRRGERQVLRPGRPGCVQPSGGGEHEAL